MEMQPHILGKISIKRYELIDYIISRSDMVGGGKAQVSAADRLRLLLFSRPTGHYHWIRFHGANGTLFVYRLDFTYLHRVLGPQTIEKIILTYLNADQVTADVHPITIRI